jgi:hypothetical protein
MRFFSFKIMVLCILLPPVLYISSALFLERHLHDRYIREIQNSYIGDPRPLLDGSSRLKRVVNENIDTYLKNKWIIPLGIEVNVKVTTKDGKILYPEDFENTDNPSLIPDPAQVAAENFELMNEGILIDIDVILEHNRKFSNLILLFYVITSLMILYFHYRSATRKSDYADQQKSIEIKKLQDLEKENTERLEVLRQERKNLQSEFKRLKGILADEKKKADRNEDDLIEEIDALEAMLEENIAQQNNQQQVNIELEERIRKFEKGSLKANKQKTKKTDTVKKRFNTLYKSLSVNDRAISGYLDLKDELKIKAEEVIHQLNADPGKVTVKRKVFGGKGHKTILEVVFGYKGRLYFRYTRYKQIEVLAIGTKNTQARELEFLASL